MADEKISTPEPPEENPNLKDHKKHHAQDDEIGGHPAGNHEGSDTGSRGDHKRAGSGNHDAGSRTNKK
ncbi:MAG: hypothetical protein EOO46_18050 [Flavobacterium sp.]|nr:MAG: hypothetical protein EOO46_18050 [Flavobacterium sp.]